MIEFKSSMLTHMMYDEQKATLRVRFTRGALYEYRNVPDKLWVLFLNIRDANATHEEGMGKYSKQISIGSILHWTVIVNPALYPFTEIPKDGETKTQCGETGEQSESNLPNVPPPPG